MTPIKSLLLAGPVLLYGLCIAAAYRYKNLPQKSIFVRAWIFLTGIKLLLLGAIGLSYLSKGEVAGYMMGVLFMPFLLPELPILFRIWIFPSPYFGAGAAVVLSVLINGLIAYGIAKLVKSQTGSTP